MPIHREIIDTCKCIEPKPSLSQVDGIKIAVCETCNDVFTGIYQFRGFLSVYKDGHHIYFQDKDKIIFCWWYESIPANDTIAIIHYASSHRSNH